MTEGLSKSERIRSERRIDTLFSEGRRGYVHPLKYCWVLKESTPQETPVSVLVSVPKKVFKRAWKRNLVKRRIKESYRRRKHELVEKNAGIGRHIDIAFICAGEPKSAKNEKKNRQTAVEIPDYKTIDNAIARILEQIMARS
jgi:ribonuclease P protein component